MPDGPKTQAAAQQLVNCISTSCCASPLAAIPPPVTCSIASGHTGETLGTIPIPT